MFPFSMSVDVVFFTPYAQSKSTGRVAHPPREPPNCDGLVYLTNNMMLEWQDLRLGLRHNVHELQLSLGNLDNLLNQARPDPGLHLSDPVENHMSAYFCKASITHVESCNSGNQRQGPGP